MFTTTLLIITKNWKLSKCPRNGDWIKKLVQPSLSSENKYIYNNMDESQKHYKLCSKKTVPFGLFYLHKDLELTQMIYINRNYISV